MNRLVRVTFEQKVFAALMLGPFALAIVFLVDEFSREGLVIAVVCVLAAMIYLAVVWALQLRHDLGAALDAAPPAGAARVEAWPLTVLRAFVKSWLVGLVLSVFFAAGAAAGEGVWARLVMLPFALGIGIGLVALFAALRVDAWQRAHGRRLLRAPAWGRAALDPRRLSYTEVERDEGTLPVMKAPN